MADCIEKVQNKVPCLMSRKFSFGAMTFLLSVFFLIEVTVGGITNSMALIAESFHMLSDVASLIVGYLALKYSTRDADRETYTYGYARAEVLGALVNAVFLVALCFSITIEALKRLIVLEQIENPLLVLCVGAAGLVVNIFGMFLFHQTGHGHSHGGDGKEHGHNHGISHSHSHSHGSTDNTHISSREISAEHMERRTSKIETNKQTSNKSDQNGSSKSPKSELKEKPVGTSEKTANDTNENVFPNDGSLENQVKNNGKTKPECSPKCDESTLDIDGNQGRTIKTSSASQLNIQGVYLHILGDALGSVIVMVSALIIMYASGTWTLYVDPTMSLIMVCIILKTSIPLLTETAKILMNSVPHHIQITELKERLLKRFPQIKNVHELHVWQLAGDKIIASAHVKFESPQDYDDTANQIKEFFHNEGIHSTTVQIEYERYDSVERRGHCMVVCSLDSACDDMMCCKPEHE